MLEITQEKIKGAIETLPKNNPNIDRSSIIESLLKNIENYFNNSLDFESNAILLDGKWGSGKSWVIDALTHIYKNKNLAPKPLRIVKISAWQCYSEKEILIIMLDIVVRELKKASENQDQIKKIVNKTLKLALGFVPHIGNNEIVTQTVDFLLNAKEAPNTGTVTDSFTHLPDLTEEELSNPLGIPKINIKTPIVFVIDDLDRIHEDKLWKLLAMLSLFDKQENIMFLCVGSSDFLIQILEKKYHVKGEGENFLTKFFAKEIKLPEISYLEMLVDEFISPTRATNKEVLKFLDLVVDISTYREYKIKYLSVLKEEFGKNPVTQEEIKKFALTIIRIYLQNNNLEVLKLLKNEFKEFDKGYMNRETESYILKNLNNSDKRSINGLKLLASITTQKLVKNCRNFQHGNSELTEFSNFLKNEGKFLHDNSFFIDIRKQEFIDFIF